MGVPFRGYWLPLALRLGIADLRDAGSVGAAGYGVMNGA